MFESAAVRTAAVFYFSLRRFVTAHKPPSDAKENIANFKALICKALKCEFLFCDACALACPGMLRKSVSVLIQYEKPVLQKAINPHDCTIPIKKAQIYYFFRFTEILHRRNYTWTEIYRDTNTDEWICIPEFA